MMHQGEIAERLVDELAANGIALVTNEQLDIVISVVNFAQKEAFCDAWQCGYAFAQAGRDNNGRIQIGGVIMMHQGEIAERLVDELAANGIELVTNEQLDIVISVVNFAQKAAFCDGWQRGYAFAQAGRDNNGRIDGDDYLPVIRR